MERCAARPLRLRSLSARLPRCDYAPQSGTAAHPARRHAALPAALLQGGVPELKVGGERTVGGDRAPRRRDARHAAFHAHGGNHGGRPAALSRTVSRTRARSRRPHRIGFPLTPRGGMSPCKCTFGTKLTTATSVPSNTAYKACTSRRAAT